MMDPLHTIGKGLIVTGITLVVIGVLLTYGDKIKFGRLPGDIVYQNGNFTFYFPIVSMMIISLLLSLIFSIFKR